VCFGCGSRYHPFYSIEHLLHIGAHVKAKL